MKGQTEVNRLCMGCMSQIDDKEKPCPHCGWHEQNETVSPPQLPLMTILNGKYLVGRVLGEGGFGITYLAWDLNLDMKVAIKEYYPSGFVVRENTASTTVTPFSGSKRESYYNGLGKFVGEAKSLAKFFSLPGVVLVKDFFKENGTAYIVMEYIEGITLKQHLKEQGGKLPADQLLQMVKPLIQSLAQIHREGIIHRDISPDNIMLASDGAVKLLDFGAARYISSDGAKSLSVLLKPGYAPEEQYRSRGEQGPWTDVYALCATLYKALTGETPPESMERVIEDNLAPPGQLGAEITQAQEKVLLDGLAVFSKKRIQDMGELFNALYSDSVLRNEIELHPCEATVAAFKIGESEKVHTGSDSTKTDKSNKEKTYDKGTERTHQPLFYLAWVLLVPALALMLNFGMELRLIILFIADLACMAVIALRRSKAGNIEKLSVLGVLCTLALFATGIYLGDNSRAFGYGGDPDPGFAAGYGAALVFILLLLIQSGWKLFGFQKGKKYTFFLGSGIFAWALTACIASGMLYSVVKDYNLNSAERTVSTNADEQNTEVPLDLESLDYPSNYSTIDNTSSFARVWGDWFYYADNKRLYKIRVSTELSEMGILVSASESGSSLLEKSIVIDTSIQTFLIATDPSSKRDVIYYNCYKEVDGASVQVICKANLDGTEERVLVQASNFGSVFALDSGWLYYMDFSTCQIFRINPENQESELVCDVGGAWGKGYGSLDMVYDGKIYGSYKNSENWLESEWTYFCTGTDGQELIEYKNAYDIPAWVLNDHFYFTTEIGGLYRIGTDGMGEKQILPGGEALSNIYTYDGSFIYYVLENGEVYRTTMDGSNSERIPFPYPEEFYFRLFPSQDHKMLFFVDDGKAGWYKMPIVKTTAPDTIKETDPLADNTSDGNLPLPKYLRLSTLAGNTSGNISNGGYVVQQGDWVYYSKYAREDGLFKSKTDGSEKMQLTPYNCANMAIADDWLYYHNTSDSYKLYKMKTDGTENTLVDGTETCNYINVMDDWIYYSIGSDGLYKIRTDGTEKALLNSEASYHVNVSGGWIYFIEGQENSTIYKIKTDGTDKTRVSDDIAGYLNYVGEWLYYVNYSDQSRIYKIKPDGSGRTCLNDQESSWLNVWGDWIYYVNQTDNYSVYRLKTDGSLYEKVMDDIYGEIQLVDGEVFDVSRLP